MPTTTAPQPFQAQRTARGVPLVATYTFGQDGDPLPDGATSVTYSVANAAGTVVQTGTASLGAVVTGTQKATFTLLPANTPAVDLLTVTWTATISALSVNVVSTIDVCDARLFPTTDYNLFAELTALSLSAATLEAERMRSEDFLERECGMAFTKRYRTQTFPLGEPPSLSGGNWSAWGWPVWMDTSGGTVALSLDRPFVQTIRNLTQVTLDNAGNTTTTALNLAFSRLDTVNGIVFYRSNVGDGMFGDLTVGYEHGQWVEDVRRVCLILARYRLLNGPLDSRAVQVPAEGGGTVRLLTPGVSGAVTGIAEVDAFIQRYNRRVLGYVSGLGM